MIVFEVCFILILTAAQALVIKSTVAVDLVGSICVYKCGQLWYVGL